MQYNQSGSKAYPNDYANSTSLLAYRRVVLTAAVLAYAGVSDRALGTLSVGTQGTDTTGNVVLPTTPGTRIMIAAGVIPQYAYVYAAADGKIAATGMVLVGIALTAATADLDQVEVLELTSGIAPVTSLVAVKTADYTVTVGDSGKTFTTVGAAGTVVFAMPTATLGLKYRFRVGAAQELRIDPDGTETIALPSTGVQGAAGKYLTANADGETVDIECTKAGQWSVFGYTGTWTAEP
jgi:hypothetical protein